ncbi:hypothetical protein [Brevibacterium marinum]|uniref:Uncharacterized protein n=1 Tax=Brevibacterium marinum TaxID=418643 RepID=A0A846S3N3_9MICO|nr:hypothetical protein [Brevibacterium marinum]NJC58756.1 hypothetical protein [Brevibacterium marinum]
MRIPLKARWIIALLFLAIASQALAFAPGLHDLTAVFWGLSFAFMVGALVVAVIRFREERTKSTE